MIGKHVTRCLTLMVLTLIVSSCSLFKEYQRYERPDLYFPNAELDKMLLVKPGQRPKDHVAIDVFPPTFELDPFAAAPYKFVIQDKCTEANRAKRFIKVYPEAAVELQNMLMRMDTVEFELKPENIAQIQSNFITIQFRSCRAKDIDWATATSKGLATIKYFNITAPKAEVIEIIAASDTLISSNDTKTPYTIRVGDNCEGNYVHKNTVISIDPPFVATKNARQAGSRWTDIRIHPAKLKDLSSITVMAQSCQAVDLGWEKAEASGKAKKKTFIINTRQIDKVSSTFNVWSKDDVREEFGETFSRTFIVADVVFVNSNNDPILIYGSTIAAKVRFLVAEDDVKKHYGDNITHNPQALLIKRGDRGTLAHRFDHIENYRPMSFSDVLAIFSYQQASHPHQRLVSLMKSLGTVLTGGAVFGVSESYIEGVSFFTGVINPEVEKFLLWDILLHVKNLQERSLKEVEEIPAKGQLRRVVFFPRRPIYNILPEMPVYITEIRPNLAAASATIIEKQATVPANTN